MRDLHSYAALHYPYGIASLRVSQRRSGALRNSQLLLYGRVLTKNFSPPAVNLLLNPPLRFPDNRQLI
ncbi:hypothetical protein H6G17_01570 [Chroococcidiopsis sp. FACHB-1243]|uniref:hypothetical protein n=1 Tax=Chroococcidiopsis sp. [FACHB-1243] TaxID=2692781 RepID=UPI001784B6E0|nr:hypothetical protein [Chroococcidiopsis sp. [FACHB-1243]]MBD2304211.1 hypothetical protein [Chroococcidiopsis sp. [FACHB-1243]]